MKGLAVIATILIAITILFSISHYDEANEQRRWNEMRYERERQELELERERLRLQEQQEWGILYRRIGETAMMIIFITAAGITLVLITKIVWTWDPVIWPRNGTLPIRRSMIDSEQIYRLVESYHKVLIAEAMHRYQPQVPHSLNYSPRSQYSPPLLPSDTVDEVDEEDDPAGSIVVPSFADLLRNGDVALGKLLHLGFSLNSSTPTEIRDDFRGLYSVGVGGLQGTGKTTTTRFLLAQLAMHGAQIGVIDPHYHPEQTDSLGTTVLPLRSHLISDPAQVPDAWQDTLEVFHDKLERRKRYGWEGDQRPYVLAVDEFTAIVRSPQLSELFLQLLQALPQEGRKWHIFCLLLGQGWKHTQTGGTEIRDSLNSFYVHRMKRRVASMMLNLGRETPETAFLPRGQAYLYRANAAELELVQIPWTTLEDLHTVNGATAPQPILSDEGERLTFDHSRPPKKAPSSEQGGRDPVVSLFRSGVSFAGIVQQLYPEIMDARRYAEKMSEIEERIRSELEKGN